MLQSFRRILREKRGQSVVELALILPVILLLLTGVVEFGRVFHSYLLITQASREGARLAVVGESDTAIMQRVEEITALLDQSRIGVEITPGESDRVRGVGVRVEVDYQFQLIIPDILPMLPDPLLLSAKTVMRME